MAANPSDPWQSILLSGCSMINLLIEIKGMEMATLSLVNIFS